MPFTVLSDSSIQTLLSSLRRPEILTIQDSLSTAFQQYSTESESQYQPPRTSITRPNGQTTLFMPSTSPISVGTKIIGIPPANAVGKTLAGVLVLCDGEGKPKGILNAEEITAFRTSLGSMVLFEKRKKVGNLVVFGAGKQAFWHVRLAVLLKGEEVKKVTVVNRSEERTKGLLEKLKGSGDVERIEFKSLATGSEGFDEGELEKVIEEAEAIFCTTPSTTPLFPASYLLNENKTNKGKYISAIGSYKTSMKELDPALFRQYVDSQLGHHPQGKSGSAIIVDTREGCFEESGEIVQGKIEHEKVVEVGELLDIQKEGKDEKLKSWVEEGFVVYKSVGMGVMDLAVGDALLDLAREKGVGVSMEEGI